MRLPGGGFARFRCVACRQLGSWPSRVRAAVLPAHLIDQVFPDAPVRQWVLSLPHRARCLLNAHLHALVLDGVFATDGARVRFHSVRRLTRGVAAVVGARRARRGATARAPPAYRRRRESSGHRISGRTRCGRRACRGSVSRRAGALGPREGARAGAATPDEVTPLPLGPRPRRRITGFSPRRH